MVATVLVVEDEANIATAIRFNLEREGFDVHTAEDGEQALESAGRLRPDLVILDLMLPLLNGTEVLRRLRRDSDVPVLVLTARSSEADRVRGLDLGADDYITKPFSVAELLARVRAHLRRRDGTVASATPIVRFGDFTLDTARRELLQGGVAVSLRPKEYDLLAYLAQRPGRAINRDEILNEVWNYNFAGGSRTVDVHVRWLRRKIEADPASPQCLLTVRGAGYRFEL